MKKIPIALGLILLFSCILLASCGSESENRQETTTVTVEQTTTEITVPRIVYDSQDDVVPKIPMNPNYNTKIIFRNFLGSFDCQGAWLEQVQELHRATNALSISKSEHYYEPDQADVDMPTLITVVETEYEAHLLFFRKVQANTFIFLWSRYDRADDKLYDICSVKVEDEYIYQLITELIYDVDEWYWSGEPEGWWESN